jgi:cyclopropane-fatty-acyl-phospholipid synthase
VNAAGLQDRIQLVFCDYREVVVRYGVAAFDAVVSCEMIEAVGHEHLPIYFDTIGQSLKPGGYFSMQVCSSHDYIE